MEIYKYLKPVDCVDHDDDDDDVNDGKSCSSSTDGPWSDQIFESIKHGCKRRRFVYQVKHDWLSFAEKEDFSLLVRMKEKDLLGGQQTTMWWKKSQMKMGEISQDFLSLFWENIKSSLFLFFFFRSKRCFHDPLKPSLSLSFANTENELNENLLLLIPS